MQAADDEVCLKIVQCAPGTFKPDAPQDEREDECNDIHSSIMDKNASAVLYFSRERMRAFTFYTKEKGFAVF